MRIFTSFIWSIMINPCCSWCIMYRYYVIFSSVHSRSIKKNDTFQNSQKLIYFTVCIFVREKVLCRLRCIQYNFYKSSWPDWSNAIYGNGTVVKNNKRRLRRKALAGVTNQSVIKRRYFWCILCVSINSFLFQIFKVCINAIYRNILI